MASKRKSAAARLALETAALEQACAVDVGQPITPEHARDKARVAELVDIERAMRESNQRLRDRIAVLEMALARRHDTYPYMRDDVSTIAEALGIELENATPSNSEEQGR